MQIGSVIPILWMSKLRWKEVRKVVQGYTFERNRPGMQIWTHTSFTFSMISGPSLKLVGLLSMVSAARGKRQEEQEGPLELLIRLNGAQVAIPWGSGWAPPGRDGTI